MKREYQDAGGGGGGGYGMGVGFGGGGNNKSKMMMVEEDAGGMDELLAALGYKVRASEMADVAQKLEQLEMAMIAGGGCASSSSFDCDNNAVLAHLASETVHYNPSDLSTWLESMLSEINATPLPAVPLPPAHHRDHPLPHASSSSLDHHHLRPPPIHDPLQAATDSSTITTADFPADPTRNPDYDDLQAISGSRLVYGSIHDESVAAGSTAVDTREKKRLKSSSSSSAASTAATTRVTAAAESTSLPVVLVEEGQEDSQETGIRLVHTLMACAEAVQQVNHAAAEALVKQVGLLALSQCGPMGKVATYFAVALARRIYQIHPACAGGVGGGMLQDHATLVDAAFSDLLQTHFYESCPYLKFAHFTANQAILEAFAGKRRVHVIDFSMKQGLQWPALMQALALRPGGPPSFRLTGIGHPQPDNTDALQQVGWKLAQLAETIHVEFEYRGYVANSLSDLEPYMLEVAAAASSSSSSSSVAAGKKGSICTATTSCTDGNNKGGCGNGGGVVEEEEVVAVNSVFELHRLLATPGAIEKVLRTVRAVRPTIVTVVEQEANHNGPVFLDRFTEALHYYSTMFDSLEGCGGGKGMAAEDQVMTEVYLGRQICNVVACEGPDRMERHETTPQWRARMEGAGFEAAHLGSNAFKQASMLLALFAGGDGYRVEERDGCLMLGWHTRPLITTSAWRLAAAATAT